MATVIRENRCAISVDDAVTPSGWVIPYPVGNATLIALVSLAPLRAFTPYSTRCRAFPTVSGANRHDSAVLEELLDDRFSDSPGKTLENLCLDAGYVGKQDIVTSHGYELHIRPRDEEKKELQNNPDFRDLVGWWSHFTHG